MTPDPDDLAAWVEAPALAADPRPGTRSLDATSLGVLGIQLLHCTRDAVIARMPLGSAGVARGTLLVLAETVASTAAGIAAGDGRRAFGAELNASWPAPATGAIAVARATPLRLDQALHTWAITIVDEAGSLLLEGRCTLGVVDVS
jgi:uncharacterized protein (TIGR00369 family)